MTNTVKFPNFLNETMELMQLGLRVAVAMLMKKAVEMISYVFVGHLGKHYLSAAGLASVTSNVFGNSIIIGMGGALSTICSQAHGANDFEALNLSLQRALVILFCLCIPISILWVFATPIMISLGQDSSIAEDACRYLTFLLPALFSFSCIVCLQNWLYAQQKASAVVCIAVVSACCHPIWCFLYIHTVGLHFLGAALAVSTTRVFEMVLLLIYLRCSGSFARTRFQLSFKAFTGWTEHIRLGLPNVMMMSEWWASEVAIFLSGLLSNPDVEVGAMSVYQTLLGICFALPMGIHTAVCARVGHALGASGPSAAVLSATTAPLLAGGIGVILSVVLLAGRAWVGRLFTSDLDVIQMVSELMVPLAIYVVADGMQCAFTGVIKGAGKQRVASPVVIFSYYIVGLPLAALLAFKARLGVPGLCWGLTVGTWTHFLLYLLLVCRIDWKEESIAARKLLLGIKGKSAGSTENAPKTTGDVDEMIIFTACDEKCDMDSSTSSSICSEVPFPDPSPPSFMQQLHRLVSSLVPFGRVISSAQYELVQSYTSALEDVSAHDDDDDDTTFTISL